MKIMHRTGLMNCMIISVGVQSCDITDFREILVFTYKSTWCYNLEDQLQNLQHCENFVSCVYDY